MAKSLDPKPEHFTSKTMPAVLKTRTTSKDVKGFLPLKAGEVLLTEREEQQLAALFGWKKGDPLPGNIAKLVSEVKAEDARELQAAKPPQDHPGLKIEQDVDISQLSTDRQTEIRNYLKTFKQLAPQIESMAKNETEYSQLTPAAQQAIKEAGQGIEVVDSRDLSSDIQRRIDIAEGKTPVETDETGLEEEESVQETPRGELEITSEDKLNYLVSILGCQPFCKEYSLFGGKILLGFTDLPTAKTEKIFNAVVNEVRSGRIEMEGSGRQIEIYRLLHSLDYIKLGEVTYKIAKSLDMYEDKPLSEILTNLQLAMPLNKEGIWSSCRACHVKFMELVSALDKAADDPNFWQGIEG